MRWLFLIAGAVATAAMLAISMRLNYLFGSGLGQTPDKALVFGCVSVVADAWKALGPVFILALARGRRWPTAGAASIVWAACFLYSVSSALGITIHDRSALTGGRETLRAGYADAVAELDTLEAKRSALAKHRTTREVEAAISAALIEPVLDGRRVRGTVAALSADCTRVNWRTAQACADIAALRQELAVAVEGARLDRRIAELRTQARRLRERGATLSADPQAESLARLTRGWLGVRDVGPGLALLLAAVIEVVSAFGPVVVAGYAEATRRSEVRAVSQPTGFVVAGRDRPRPAAVLHEEHDLVMEYMAERIAPAPEAHAIGGDEIFSDYVAWCSRKKCAPLTLHEFLAEFDRKRREHDLEAKIWKFGNRYFGIRLSSLLLTN